MNCFNCRHVDTGGDDIKCGRHSKGVLSKEEVLKGCKYIRCFSEEDDDERYPIQVAPSDRGVNGTLFALCNDRTIWSYGTHGWSRIEEVPQRMRRVD